MPYQDILFEKRGQVALITLNRPERLNAMTPDMMESVVEAFSQVREDSSVRVAVLTGAGKAFSAGADVGRQARTIEGGEEERLKLFTRNPDRSIPATIRGLEKPVLCAVNGVAVGMAFSIVMACDIRLASDQARFGAVFVKRALIPGNATTYLLPRIVGTSKACELAFTGDIIDAPEALRLGIVSRVVPHDELLGQTLELANRIAKGPPVTISLTKRLLYQGLSNELEAQMSLEIYAQSICHQTEDHKEGVRSFLEKREPVFKGR